jgi:hypothetical protein
MEKSLALLFRRLKIDNQIVAGGFRNALQCANGCVRAASLQSVLWPVAAEPVI